MSNFNHPPGAATGAAAWDAAAPGWHNSADLVRHWLRGASTAMLDAGGVGPGLRVLDVAAGAGDQTLDIARRVGPEGHVLATDISAGILALADARLQQAGISNTSTQVADAQHLALAGAGFDAAVCRLGLMFCAEPDQALQSVRAALRPGGRFSALVFGEAAANPCITVLARTAQRHAGRPPGNPYEPGTLLSLGRPGLLETLLKHSGFDNVRVETLQAPFELPSLQHYINFVRNAAAPVLALLQSLAPAAQAAAWADITDQLQAYTTATGWCGPNQLLLCSATAPG